MQCPKCRSIKIYKNGKRPHWVKGLSGHKHKEMKQAYLCDKCGHQWKVK